MRFFRIRPTVIHPHLHGLAIAAEDAQPRSKRIVRMGRREVMGIKALATGRAPPVQAGAVPGGNALLIDHFIAQRLARGPQRVGQLQAWRGGHAAQLLQRGQGRGRLQMRPLSTGVRGAGAQPTSTTAVATLTRAAHGQGCDRCIQRREGIAGTPPNGAGGLVSIQYDSFTVAAQPGGHR